MRLYADYAYDRIYAFIGNTTLNYQPTHICWKWLIVINKNVHFLHVCCHVCHLWYVIAAWWKVRYYSTVIVNAMRKLVLRQWARTLISRSNCSGSFRFIAGLHNSNRLLQSSQWKAVSFTVVVTVSDDEPITVPSASSAAHFGTTTMVRVLLTAIDEFYYAIAASSILQCYFVSIYMFKHKN